MSLRVTLAVVFCASVAHAAPGSPTASVLSSISNPSEGTDETLLIAQELGIDISESTAPNEDIDALISMVLPQVEKYVPAKYMAIVKPAIRQLKNTFVKQGPYAVFAQVVRMTKMPMIANLLNKNAPNVDSTCVQQKATGDFAKILTPLGVTGPSAFCPGFCGLIPEEAREHMEICSCCEGVKAASGCGSFCAYIPGPEDEVFGELVKTTSFNLRSFVSDCSTCPSDLKIPSDACAKFAALPVPIPASIKKVVISALKCPSKKAEGPCKRWCDQHHKSWKIKCGWKNCKGCSDC